MMGQQKSTHAKSDNNPIQAADVSETMFQRSVSTTSASKIEASIEMPAWLNVEQFMDILHEKVENFEKVTKFKACPALRPEENCMTLIVRISIDVELKDKSNKKVSLIMKMAPDTENMRQLINNQKIFEKELTMYFDVIPKLEQVYREIGVDVCFAPKAYKLKKDPGHHNVLIEDLHSRGFKHANRLDGFNMEHTIAVLRKMAQFHAASANCVATNGPFSEHVMKTYRDKEFHNAMMSSIKNDFLSSMRLYKDSEKYRDAVEHSLTAIDFDGLAHLDEIDSDELNVINHGYCWSNNILFQYDQESNILDTYLIDLQLSSWGSPSRDLYMFIISSVSDEIKLKHFDYFVRFYHDNLAKNLKALRYPKHIPSLREFHTSMIEKGTWAFASAVIILPTVLLDLTQTADVENSSASSEEATNLRKLKYTNSRYCNHMDELLPWMYYRGIMDPIQICAITDSGANSTVSKSTTDTKVEETKVAPPVLIPAWVNEEHFEGILRNEFKGFQSINKLTVAPATTVGENYASVMLKVDIEMHLQHGGTDTTSYMLKTSHSTGQGKAITNIFEIFKKEAFMYHEIIPQFEQIFKSAGADVTFAPRCFKFVKDPGCETILLENLRTSGFKNVNRLEGLDMQHTKSVLQKLAQFHAASAVYFETKGPFPEMYLTGIYVEENRAMIEMLTDKFNSIFIECAKAYANSEEYLEKLHEFRLRNYDIMMFLNKIQPYHFNVLNHGDCWCNNIMFQYDSDGNVVNTYLIDFQMPKYGSLAQDLFYFLLSSTKLDIKLEHFDYCIRYYHENLKKSLELLKYTKRIPTLRELHTELMYYGAWGLISASGVMATILLEPNGDANLESITGDNEESAKFKMNMFSAKRYRSHAEPLLTWLYRRGLFDFGLDVQ